MSEPTRLILTSLPPSLTLAILRSHLSKCPPAAPQLTDLKILLKPDGTSRRIGFIGFKTHQEGDRVRKWLTGSWLTGTKGGARIGCEWAIEVSLNLFFLNYKFESLSFGENTILMM
jgi:multiple RNA-binding domain-containing protein 1